MGDKEYHVANFATFVSHTVLWGGGGGGGGKFFYFCFQNGFIPPPPPQKKKKMDEFNFKPVQHCINKMDV